MNPLKSFFLSVVVLLFIYNPTLSNELKPLFNGEDLTGWVNVMSAKTAWAVSDQSIVTTGSPKSVLRTDQQYENYVLDLEFKKEYESRFEPGRAGVVIHADALPAMGQPWPRGINLQFDQGSPAISATGEASIQVVNNPSKPDFPESVDVLSSGEVPSNGWNHARIVSQDGMITLSVNGELVAMGVYSSLRKGYIALKSDGVETHFRNIEIEALPGSNPSPKQIADVDQGFKSMFNGENLSEHWEMEPGHQGHWTAQDWLIHYDGKSEEERKNLWTKKEYGDFIMIADIRFTREPELAKTPVVLPNGDNLLNKDGSIKMVDEWYNGDSGIYVRGHYKNQVNMGYRFIGSGEVYGYRADEEMPAEVRKALVPKFKADNPPLEWNRYIITMKGDRISVELNGHLVIDNAQLPGIAESGKIALQDDHARNNRFYFGNLYIKELK